MSDQLTDFLLALGIDHANRNARKAREIMTWTEPMKEAYWQEQARLIAEQQRKLKRAREDQSRLFIFLAVIFGGMGLMAGANVALVWLMEALR